MSYQQTYFDTLQGLQQSLALRVAQDLKRAIAERGRAVFVVSGGKSPRAFFAAVSQIALDWSRVDILLGDERIATNDLKQTNAHLITEYLLQDKAQEAHFWPLWNGQDLPEQALIKARMLFDRFSTDFDVVVLGMGEDGHTASLFPEADNIEQALADNAPDVLLIQPHSAPFLRISQTRQRLMRARALYLPVFGAAKMPILRAAQTAWDKRYPISSFLHTPGLPLSILCYEGGE